MDLADSAQQEMEHHEALQIANLKRPDVVPTDECIECGNEISEGRKQAIKTNLCIGCAEMQEIKRKQFRR